MRSRRLLAIGGLLGPAAFVTAWTVLGVRTRDYSSVHESISRLAAMDAPTRKAMTAGVVAFSAGVPLYAQALRTTLPGPPWALATVAGIATLGVAAFPLGLAGNNAAHGVCVAVAYVALIALPLTAARSMVNQGRSPWARASTVTGLVTGCLLVASLLTSRTGLFQRAGLAVVDLWIMATAIDMLRRPSP